MRGSSSTVRIKGLCRIASFRTITAQKSHTEYSIVVRSAVASPYFAGDSCCVAQKIARYQLCRMRNTILMGSLVAMRGVHTGADQPHARPASGFPIHRTIGTIIRIDVRPAWDLRFLSLLPQPGGHALIVWP